MRYALPVVAGLIAVLLGVFRSGGTKAFDLEDVEVKKLDEQHFSVNMPVGWNLVGNVSGAFGNHKLEYKKSKEMVELSWQPGSEMSLDEFIATSEPTLAAMGISIVSTERERLESLEYFTVLGKLVNGKRTAWLSISEIRCAKTGLEASLSVAAHSRKNADGLGRRLLRSFECRGETTLSANRTFPDTNLGEGWAVTLDIDVAEVLHVSGKRRATISPIAGNISAAFKAQPKMLADGLATAAGMSLELVGSPGERVGFDNKPVVSHEVLFDGKKAFIGVMFCSTLGNSFLILDDSELEPGALLGAFGCPRGGRSVSALPGPCKLGIGDDCEPPPAEAEPPSAE